VEEAGLKPENVTDWGWTVPKLPMTWIERVTKLNHTKLYGTSFVGRAENLNPRRERAIVFVHQNFGEDDYFKATDTGLVDYSPIGTFDHTLEQTTWNQLEEENMSGSYGVYFDEDYFQVMASSNFTLCPGGDRPNSLRFYEAIMAGSIPVIFNHASDMSSNCGINAWELVDPELHANLEAYETWPCWSAAVNDIGYKYYELDAGDKPVYREDWVRENLELFLRYQTFLFGDNVPQKQQSGQVTGLASP